MSKVQGDVILETVDPCNHEQLSKRSASSSPAHLPFDSVTEFVVAGPELLPGVADDVVAVRQMIGMSEDTDVGVQGLQRVFCMSRVNCGHPRINLPVAEQRRWTMGVFLRVKAWVTSL